MVVSVAESVRGIERRNRKENRSKMGQNSREQKKRRYNTYSFLDEVILGTRESREEVESLGWRRSKGPGSEGTREEKEKVRRS